MPLGAAERNLLTQITQDTTDLIEKLRNSSAIECRLTVRSRMRVTPRQDGTRPVRSGEG